MIKNYNTLKSKKKNLKIKNKWIKVYTEKLKQKTEFIEDLKKLNKAPNLKKLFIL